MIHAAGINDDGVLVQQSWARMARVLAPKVAGAWHLHEQTRHLPLDCFVLFSSAAALLGTAAQGPYAAANAYLDALATARRTEGLPALSIGWGPWEKLGMTARISAQDNARIARLGLEPLAADEALAAFDEAFTHAEAVQGGRVAVLKLSRAALQASDEPLFAALRTQAPAAQESAAATPQPAAPTFLEGWAATPPARRDERLRAFVQAQANKVLGLPSAHAIPARRPFSELGLDSLMAVELRNSLSAALAAPLPATLLFDYPTGEALCAYLRKSVASLAAEAAAPEPVAVAPIRPPAQPADDLAALSDEEAEAQLLAELASLHAAGEGR